jgi:hypothetical protein
MGKDSDKHASATMVISSSTHELRAWLWCASNEQYHCDLQFQGETEQAILPASGDALLLTNGGNAIGVRRIYLARHIQGGIRFYFDRIIDFAEPLPLSQISVNLTMVANDGSEPVPMIPLELDKLAHALQLNNLPVFEELPELAWDDPHNQDYVRELLQIAVSDDLLGPALGENEEIVGMSVRDRYLVGKLSPKVPPDEQGETRPFNGQEEKTPDLQSKSNAEHQPLADLATSDVDEEQDERPIDIKDSQSLAPSSLGFTFCIDGSLPPVQLSVTWGRYERTDSENAVDDAGKPRRCWKRSSAGGTRELKLQEGAISPFAIDGQCPDVFVQGNVSRQLPDGSRLVTLFLVNNQTRPPSNQDSAWVFQPELKVSSPDGAAIFRRRPMLAAETGDEEVQGLDMMYRHKVEFAVGHGISVHAEVSKDNPEQATEVRTVVLPQYEVPVTETPGNKPEDRPAMRKMQAEGWLDMRRLAELPLEELVSGLSILTDDYDAWIQERKAESQTPEFARYATPAKDALRHCRQILKRLREGIQVIHDNPAALKAFRFANCVMADQRVHTIYSLAKRRGENKVLGEIDVMKNHSWRPFQLAFILLSVPSLAYPAHNDRTEPLEAIADLLWFPTGGGKTEAYLGVAAFAMAIRRLQKDTYGLDSSRGLTVIMRYTLRLLTIQQFQRAAALLCAMELQRRNDLKKWGDEPFTLGLWVGQRTTPNSTAESNRTVENERDNKFGSASTPAQLTTCPWCGEPIEPGKNIEVDTDTGRTRIYCGDKLHRCDFTKKHSPNGLPILVVDDEIYHHPPTMLISTVDKFAMMAWKGEIRTLFGKVTEECPRCGLMWPGSCSGSHRKTRDLPAVQKKAVLPIRPPDLIIQDEFHLISGPLGTMVGLYETAIDELCCWDYHGKKVRPKVIASTATVRKADKQVHNVFLRKVSIFPPHGLDIEDNFFSVQRSTEKSPGRRYLGICAPGASRPAVLIRVYVALLTGSQSLFEHFGVLADPYMTLVGYFNSLRELGGMRRLAEDDVQTRSYRVALDKNLSRPGLAQRKVRNVDELTSRVSNKDIPKKLDHLEIRFKKVWGEDEPHAMDVVLATNMLSVGVDVNRLGLMVVNGQPKNTAEYIQATSRVGRSFPGLVCTVLAWARPRDFSHYESFEHYHSTFYKHVEAQSVTPFSARALDRGMTGTMVSLLRLQEASFAPNEGARAMTDPAGKPAEFVKEVLEDRAWSVEDKATVKELTADMVKSRLDKWVKSNNVPGQKLGYEKRKNQGDVVNLLFKPGKEEWGEFTVPTSMREVEAGVNLVLEDTPSVEDDDWDFQQTAQDDGGAQ